MHPPPCPPPPPPPIVPADVRIYGYNEPYEDGDFNAIGYVRIKRPSLPPSTMATCLSGIDDPSMPIVSYAPNDDTWFPINGLLTPVKAGRFYAFVELPDGFTYEGNVPFSDQPPPP